MSKSGLSRNRNVAVHTSRAKSADGAFQTESPPTTFPVSTICEKVCRHHDPRYALERVRPSFQVVSKWKEPACYGFLQFRREWFGQLRAFNCSRLHAYVQEKSFVAHIGSVPSPFLRTCFPPWPLKRSSSQTFPRSWYPYISQ